MNRRKGMLGSWLVSSLAIWPILSLSGCGPTGATTAAKKAEAPAKVSGAPKEAELSTVTLTADAEKRLGVKLATIELKDAARTSIHAGEVVIPSGRLINVTSPFVGLIKSAGDGLMLEPGVAVKEGQPIFQLVPILSPEAKAQIAPLLIESEGQVKAAVEQLNVARVRLDREQGMLRDKIGNPAAVVDAEATLKIAQTALKNAQDRNATLSKVAADAETGVGNIQTITSPITGVLQNVHVTAGQKVAAGAALFEVAGLDPVWVKVPVYVGDERKLAKDKPAAIGGLADPPGAPGERLGKPTTAPPIADPLAATISVFYAVDNKDGAFRPGQRVGVVLPMLGESLGLCVSKSALIVDIYGGTWVYEKVGDHSYARRRVMVNRVVGDTAVLATGPKEGTKVVTDGVAEIHGAEFGNGK